MLLLSHPCGEGGEGGEGQGQAVGGAAGPSEGSCAGAAAAGAKEAGSTAGDVPGVAGAAGAAGMARAGGDAASEEQAEQRPTSRGFAVGAAVVVCGLQGATQHNGKRGTVVGVDAESGRFAVSLVDDAGTQLRIKAANLLPADGGGAGKGGERGEGGEGKGEGRSQGEGRSPAEAAGAQGESAAMLAMMESMWRVSLLDIESTLRHVCNKVPCTPPAHPRQRDA